MQGPFRILTFLFTLLLAAGPSYAQIDQSDMAADLAEALTFDKYPTYQQYDTMMHKFASDYPAICRIDTFGLSRQGRLLLALKISDNVGMKESEPDFFYTATMHGDELVGYILLLRLADFLLSEYGSNSEVTELVNKVEIWLNPLSNPDETYYPDADSTVVSSRRPDITSLNLNRNFPDPKAGEANDTTGKQLEIQNMMLFMMKNHFHMSANIHSGAEVVNYPWDYKYELHPDDAWYYFISREYADEARALNASYMNGFPDGVTNGADWYVIYGGRQDYVNHYLQGREVTLELSNVKKLPSELLDLYWDYNKWSLFNMISQSSYGIHGIVRDAKTFKPLAAKIVVDEHDDASSFVYSDSTYGRFYRYLKEGSYDLIVSADSFQTDTVLNVPVTDYHATQLIVDLNSSSDTIIIPPDTVGISGQLREMTDVSIYPNPAHETIVIELSDPSLSICGMEVLSIEGRTISKTNIKTGSAHATYDVSDLNTGIYILRIKTKISMHYATFLIGSR